MKGNVRVCGSTLFEDLPQHHLNLKTAVKSIPAHRCQVRLENAAADLRTRHFREAEANLLLLFYIRISCGRDRQKFRVAA